MAVMRRFTLLFVVAVSSWVKHVHAEAGWSNPVLSTDRLQCNYPALNEAPFPLVADETNQVYIGRFWENAGLGHTIAIYNLALKMSMAANVSFAHYPLTLCHGPFVQPPDVFFGLGVGEGQYKQLEADGSYEKIVWPDEAGKKNIKKHNPGHNVPQFIEFVEQLKQQRPEMSKVLIQGSKHISDYPDQDSDFEFTGAWFQAKYETARDVQMAELRRMAEDRPDHISIGRLGGLAFDYGVRQYQDLALSRFALGPQTLPFDDSDALTGPLDPSTLGRDWKNPDFKVGRYHIAVHVRRGDALRGTAIRRMLPDNYYENVVDQVWDVMAAHDEKTRGGSAQGDSSSHQKKCPAIVHVYSQGKRDETQNRYQWTYRYVNEKGEESEFGLGYRWHECVRMHVDDDAMASYHHLVAADVMISSRSMFSHFAAVQSRNVRVGYETDHYTFKGIPGVVSVTNEQGNFDTSELADLWSSYTTCVTSHLALQHRRQRLGTEE